MLKEGDRVQIVDRAPTVADARTGLYYNFYRGLRGTVFKIYGDGPTAQAAVDVDLDSLPEEIACRHLETRDRMRATLNGDAKRTSAPGMEHEFRLLYVVLVAVSDLIRKQTSASRRAALASGNGKAAHAAS